jgi:hypothetical protein
MRKTLELTMLLVGLVVAGMVLAAPIARQPFRAEVLGVSTMILPPVDPTSQVAWAASTAYAHGDILTNSAGIYYWCVVAGTTETSTVGLVHYDGDATNGSATFRVVNRQRNGLVIVNDGASNIYTSVTAPAVAGRGTRLNANGGGESYYGEDCPQSGMWAVHYGAAAYSNGVTVQEK